MDLAMELEKLMMGMVELPILYNALFPAADSNTASNTQSASSSAIKASESFNKQDLLSAHKADGDRFTSWLEIVDTTTAAKERERKELSKVNGKENIIAGGNPSGKGLLLRLRESVVEIPPQPPAPLGILKPIKLTELHLDRQHYGRVLYGKLCAKAFKMTAVLTLLEEPTSGSVIKLAIYNAVPSTATLAEVQSQFLEGSRVAIKEPYFKRYKDQTVGLRVNNPGDVVFLRSSLDSLDDGAILAQGQTGPESIPVCDNKIDVSYDELRLEGNRAFSAGDWKGAASCYTTSIRKALNSTIPTWKSDNSLPKHGCTQGKKLSQAHNVHTEIAQNHTKKSGSKKSAKKRSRPRNEICEQGRNQINADLNLKAKSALLAAYSNRSEAWLRLHRHEEALADAEKALKIDPTHVKSMFRRGRALHFLQRYSAAVQCLQAALLLSPMDSGLVKSLKESLAGDLQSRLGVFDLSSFYLGNTSDPPPHCADFVGPISIAQMENSKYGSGQRGIVVTKAVKAGDLLLASNPLAVARVEGENIEFHLIPATRRMNDASQEDLVTQLYNLTRSSPKALRQLHSLYNGGRNTGQQIQNPAMELFLPGSCDSGVESQQQQPAITNIRKTCNSGAGSFIDDCQQRADTIATNRTSDFEAESFKNIRGTCDFGAQSFTEDRQQQPDISNIRHIVQWNAFDEHGYTPRAHGKRGLRGFCSGIWALPSFINHSCLPNVSRVHIGDAMLVYASRDLEAGEEICLPYFDILSPLPHRREKSLRGWGFVCRCPRCNLEESLRLELNSVSDRFSRLEEEAMPAIQDPIPGSAVAKMSSSYMSDGYFRHTPQFVGLAGDVEILLSSDRFGHLSAEKRKWVRASYAIAYVVGISTVASFSERGADPESRAKLLGAAVESLGEVFPGNSQTLSTATMLMEDVRKQNGQQSHAFRNAEERVLYICRCMFGNQKVSVLRSIVRALQEGKMEV